MLSTSLTRKLRLGLISLFLSLFVSGCNLLQQITKPKETPTEELCELIEPKVPEILTRETSLPEICRSIGLNDDLTGCIEALLGGPDNPEPGAFRACNNDKAKIKSILEKEQ